MPDQQPENPVNSQPGEGQQSKGQPSDIGNAANSQPIQAELVQAELVEPTLAPTAELVMAPPNYQLPAGYENLSATGGAVGALVLGIWSILGSLLTPYAAINSILGIMLGFWGITSTRKKRLALIGIVLSGIGLAMSLFEVSRIISLFFADEPTA